MQTRSVHELKCWPAYFAAVRSGAKSFEIRRNDRDFAIGDTLRLMEFDPSTDTFTGQVEERLVTFLLSEEAFGGVVHGFVAIGFGPLPQLSDVVPAEHVTPESLGDWHATAAHNASLRADNARRTSKGYQLASMPVAADKHAAVAQAAEDEAAFHTAAAALVRAGAQAEAA